MTPPFDNQHIDPDHDDLGLEAELARFEAEERDRLGLSERDAPSQWADNVASKFTKAQRAHTTLLVCGLTMSHDLFIKSGLRGIGYNVESLDVPSNDALRYGKEFGNRGQCNPTYFTVGNLVKFLSELRDRGVPTKDIVERYVFVTAGACGPCRFGTYVTEYRKALRDSGFEGFRVLLFQQTGGLKQATGEEVGLEINPTFFKALTKAIIVGDVLNALAYRIRPYEVQPGATDAALERCKTRVAAAMENNTSLIAALVSCRRELSAVGVDRTKVKPKVAIIGEFWAMTTEGDGNYGLQRFLEQEGAECDIQLVTAWVLYMIWQARFDTEHRATLRGTDDAKFGIAGVDVRKKLLTLAVADKAVRGIFQSVAHVMGLYHYHLADMDEVADVSHAFYDNHLRGGEGHMEVGKLILNVAKSKVNMTLSVKPFGCMPSSSVSDGVQSLITEMFPKGIFLPIETSGDGAVNVYSRVQMQMFKARQAAQREVEDALDETGQTIDEVQAYLAAHPRLGRAFHKPPHRVGCTAADLVYEVGARRRPWHQRARSRLTGLLARRGANQGPESLVSKAARAAQRMAPHTAPQPDGARKLPVASA
jgi:predicted nucleotide-binding protein (sugar kinase/HSP70/actin superfamily)